MKDASAIKDDIRRTYRRRAARYDFTANLYYLIGVREYAYRKKAIAALNPKSGDTIVEIGCGTGINFPLIERYIGPKGKIIGVDLTDAMLDQARRRAAEAGWTNVELVQADAASYRFPEGVGGILSTFAISLVPEAGAVIERGAASLKPGGRWVICDMQLPKTFIARLAPFLLPLVRPFGVSKEHIERRPWEAIERTFRKTLGKVEKTDLYGGILFLISGEK